MSSSSSKPKYANFVRSASSSNRSVPLPWPSVTLNGEEAKKLYLEEVEDVSDNRELVPTGPYTNMYEPKIIQNINEINFSDKKIFLCAQNNDVDMLRLILDKYPDKINLLDDYGWSLLMIACQGDSVQAAAELINRNIDTSVRDKAGNSAHSLVIKSGNLLLADLLLSNRSQRSAQTNNKVSTTSESQVAYPCEICNNTCTDKAKHLSSTIHNINACKGKKIPSYYTIPQSNKGYQIMLKVGWDKDSGLGPDGAGKKYPLRAVEKKDRKGLGHVNKKKEENVKHVNKKILVRDHRRMEVNFRREFY